MFECPDRGILKTGSKPWGIPEIATDAGIHISSCANLLEELETKGVFSRRESDGAIFCRRMVRDEEERRSNAERQAEFRSRNSNAKVTEEVTRLSHASSSSSSSSKQLQTKPNPAASPPLELPIWLIESTWKDFVEMRVKLRAPLTRRASLLIFKKMEGLMASGQNPQEVLEQSIMNGWRGIFALQKGAGHVQNTADERRERVRESIRRGVGVDSQLGRTLLGELREGAKRDDWGGLPNRPKQLKTAFIA